MGTKNINKLLEEKLQELSRIENMALKDIEKAPKGKIYAVERGKANQFYWKKENEEKREYIRKSNTELISSLTQKEYAYKVLKKVQEQKQLINEFLNQYNEKAIIETGSGMIKPKRKAITLYIMDDDEFAKYWENQEQELKIILNKRMRRIEPENELEIITEKGEYVRSKSEKIIADKLLLMEVPYIYEMPLKLQGYGYVKPDFKVLNVRTRKVYYWEHFGMMDNMEYVEKSIKKINTYAKNGFIQGENLITTFESGECPLSTRNIEQNITAFLT